YQVDIDDFRADFTVAPAPHQQRRSIAANDVGKGKLAGVEFGQVIAQPIGQGRVEILNAALRIGREEARRRMIEIVDGALEIAESGLIVFAVAGYILD